MSDLSHFWALVTDDAEHGGHRMVSWHQDGELLGLAPGTVAVTPALAVDDDGRAELIAQGEAAARAEQSWIRLVRYDFVEEEMSFCPTCGSSSKLQGDCPRCNPVPE